MRIAAAVMLKLWKNRPHVRILCHEAALSWKTALEFQIFTAFIEVWLRSCIHPMHLISSMTIAGKSPEIGKFEKQGYKLKIKNKKCNVAKISNKSFLRLAHRAALPIGSHFDK
ncbi:hypothetical protein GO003_020970 [Methylicorpusculum oleiharenae]|uniref:hypothetical protein n=1 Tax=Methylicorpusculum oleiharenae TaxID=1338687 RepID=UPI00135BBEF1|nr:hypothetical protein [Methylicorpusculum oleiharenae]MCD2452860.1 hypothetical protein [Methylicorpusculum oleiharenae]